MKPVSVLICSRNRPTLLIETVGSILDGNLVPGELVIVDQSEKPDTNVRAIETRRGCRMQYIHSPTLGLSRARNIALRAATYPLVIMVDDDMLVADDWLEQLLGGLPDDPMAIATGRVLAAPADSGSVQVMPPSALYENNVRAVYRGRQTVDLGFGANVALPRDLILEIGGYDERLGAGARYPAADDNDIGLRLLDAGCTVYHLPDAVILHKAWRTRRDLIKLRWAYGRGQGAFYVKHAHLHDRWSLERARADALRRIQRAARDLFKSPRSAADQMVAVLALLSGGIEWAVRERLIPWIRRQSSTERTSGDPR